MSEESTIVVAAATDSSYTSNNTVATYILLRRKTSTEWASSGYIPKLGEPCFETDSYRYKIGDGANTWANLPYAVCAVDDGELT